MSEDTKKYDYEICHPCLSVDAMRSSGYRDAAHAVAELVDNSIQSGISTNGTTNVEVICELEEDYGGNRTVKRIRKIAVYDNASGMSINTLRMALQFGNGTNLGASEGIGKFGMGLPNSSISQC
jgi:anti-sigma regulatory factor (Ser/Thr protein kinase)